MSLYTLPPETITVSGVEYPIETDFRYWVRFQCIFLSDDTSEKKSKRVCELMQSSGLPLTKESLDAMLVFYTGASTENKTESGGNIHAFDFEMDSEYIFSAFLDSYGIDLTTAKLHWWRFKALFKSLPEDCQMCKIMMYRTIDLKKVPKEQRKFYREMKQRYSLKSGKTGYMTKEEIIEYVRKRQAEAQSHMSEMRGKQQSSMD